MANKKGSETLGFQTEVKQLLHLMIHSLYSNKEIVLRELISNASDAIDKLRFEALSNDRLYGGDSDLKIRVAYDKEARTLTVSDNGIGMTRDEVIANIGTIAKSGTKEFLTAMTADKAKDASLIGQFGVGFYSSFIIADEVTIKTLKAGSKESVEWSSKGEGEFTIGVGDKTNRGTEVILHLREGEGDFLEDWKLRSIVRKYSDHIVLPIVMKKAEWEDDKQILTDEDEVVNQASAFWAKPKNELDDASYQQFYKQLAYDALDPLVWSHNRVEGNQEYISLLYIPSHAPFDLYEPERRQGIKLYVKRVFIMEDTEKLMPRYLRFIRGVIDSNDLPLNISREILQNSRDIDAIRSASVKKILGLLDDMASKEPEKYQKFWNEFGRAFKEGPLEDSANKDKLANLFRFSSTHSDDPIQSVSLKDYVSRMKEGQDAIYYVTAESFLGAKNSPHIEIFRKKNIEVLLLSDRIDEWWLSAITEFDGKKLQSVAKGNLDLGTLEDSAEKDAQKTIEEEAKSVIEKIKTALGDQIKDVRATYRLTDSPACLVADETDLSGNLERILKAAGQKLPNRKYTLEINPNHSLVKRVSDEADLAKIADYAQILFDQALLSEGGQLSDPALFVRRMNNLFLK